MAIKYTNIFDCKNLPNLPKLEFLARNMPSGNPGFAKNKKMAPRMVLTSTIVLPPLTVTPLKNFRKKFVVYFRVARFFLIQ
jgi:hypothetical protein